MLRAGRERKQARVANSPLLEYIHGGAKQLLGDAAIPQLRADGERTEKANASPARGEVCPDEFSPELSAKSAERIRQPTRPYVVGVSHKFQWIGQTQKGAERQPHDSIRNGKIFLAQQANRNFQPFLHRRLR